MRQLLAWHPQSGRGMSTDTRLTFSLGFREGQQPMGWSLPTSLRPLQISYPRRVPPDAVRATVKTNPTHAAAMPAPCECRAVQRRTVHTDDNDLFVSFGKSLSNLTAVPAVSSTISIMLTTRWVSGCGSYGSLADVHFEWDKDKFLGG